MKRVGLKDIAKSAGVAPSTVSFVMNGKARQMRISESLEKKILAIAKKAGYRPNHMAVSLRTGKSGILGLIVESISGHFFGSLAKVIEEEAEKFGYKVVYCSTENDGKKGEELIRMLSQRQVDGYLITPALGMKRGILELVAHKRPVVLMDSYFPDISVPYVLVDNFAGVRQGMEHLVAKGYREIGFITVDLKLVQIKQRGDGYTQTLKANGIPVNKELILKLDYNCKREEAIRQIMAFIKKSPQLQAVFFATNYLGILGLESIRELGLSIPVDLAVLCFDDHDVFRLYPPGISVIRQPVEEIALAAVHLLMSLMNKDQVDRKKNHQALAAKLISRGSI